MLSIVLADLSLDEIVVDYLGKRSPVYPAVEWRINFVEDEESTSTDTDGGASYATYSIATIVLPLLIRILT